MPTSGMRIDEIGVGAFHLARQVGAYEQIEDAIDAVRRDPASACNAYGIGDIISAYGAILACQRGKDITPHLGPFFAFRYQFAPGGGDQRFTGMFVMLMPGHKHDIGPPTRYGNQPGWKLARHSAGKVAFNAAIIGASHRRM